MGQALGATHLIEGSVRKAGTRVRITAQLIKADDGTHIWTENYDRELTDVFAIQEDIATAIAGALRMPLGLAPGERLVSNRTIDPESYQQYLRAKPLVRAQKGGPGSDQNSGAACRAQSRLCARLGAVGGRLRFDAELPPQRLRRRVAPRRR